MIVCLCFIEHAIYCSITGVVDSYVAVKLGVIPLVNVPTMGCTVLAIKF